MNKNDFFFFNAVNEDNDPFPAVIKKEEIVLIIRMEDGKAGIFVNSHCMYSADTYENILIQLFNQ